MKLLKTKRGWVRWIQTVDGATYRDYAVNDEKPPLVIQASEPTQYPCYAYAVMQSYGYEEERPEYLYLSDAEMMYRELLKHTPAESQSDA